ncbi:hypothetical protein, partial [Alicyclobacillus cellulosilyticus]|uniref:hypothetical protein n=1 Tax=Alicyclobacillus cellulosilyticus TaxID=1003997 RepID=UPI001E479A9D
MLGRTVRFLGWLAVLAAAGSAWARAVSPAGWPDTCLAAACASAALGALGSMAWWWGTAAWGEPRAGKRIRTGRRVPWAARGPRRRR